MKTCANCLHAIRGGIVQLTCKSLCSIYTPPRVAYVMTMILDDIYTKYATICNITQSMFAISVPLYTRTNVYYVLGASKVKWTKQVLRYTKGVVVLIKGL